MKQTFEQWKSMVNALLFAAFAADGDSLPDVDYWNMWDEDLTPDEALQEAIEEMRFF